MSESDLKILIVDDFATMRRMEKNILKQLGFVNVFEADNGQAAMTVLETREIDMIISDWNMPGMNGLELLKTVRSDDRFKDLPFIMVTAEGQKENILQAAQNKVSQYVVKPFTADILAGKIKDVLAKKK